MLWTFIFSLGRAEPSRNCRSLIRVAGPRARSRPDGDFNGAAGRACRAAPPASSGHQSSQLEGDSHFFGPPRSGLSKELRG